MSLSEKEIIDLATASVRNELSAHIGHITVSLQGVETRLGARIDAVNANVNKIATDGCIKGAEMRAQLRTQERRSLAAGGGAGIVGTILALLGQWLFGGSAK